MIESRFKFLSVVFVPSLIIAGGAALIMCIINFKSTFNSDAAGGFVVALLLASLLGIFADLSVNATQLIYQNDGISVSNFFGLLPPRFFDYEEIDGFNTSRMNSKLGTFNYLYFIKDGRKIARTSDFYHSNYGFMLREAEDKLKNLGYIRTNLFTIIRDFTK